MVETLLNSARQEVSKYCMTECNNYCCRKGYLILKKEEVELVTKGNHTNTKKQKDGTTSLNLNKNCPSLNNKGCSIYKNPNRPQTCKNFPLFYAKGIVLFDSRCPLVQNNFFYELKHTLHEKKISYAIWNSIN